MHSCQVDNECFCLDPAGAERAQAVHIEQKGSCRAAWRCAEPVERAVGLGLQHAPTLCHADWIQWKSIDGDGSGKIQSLPLSTSCRVQ